MSHKNDTIVPMNVKGNGILEASFSLTIDFWNFDVYCYYLLALNISYVNEPKKIKMYLQLQLADFRAAKALERLRSIRIESLLNSDLRS